MGLQPPWGRPTDAPGEPAAVSGLSDWNDTVERCLKCGEDTTEIRSWPVNGYPPKEAERREWFHQMTCGCTLKTTMTWYATHGWV